MAGERYRWERRLLASSLPTATKCVGLALATFANGAGDNAHPGETRLAEACTLSVRQVRRHLAVLRDQGLVERTHEGSSTGRRALADVYQLLLPTEDDRPLTTGDPAEDHRSLATGDLWDQRTPMTGDPWEPWPRTPDMGDQNTGHGRPEHRTLVTRTPDTHVRPPTHTPTPVPPSPDHHSAATAAAPPQAATPSDDPDDGWTEVSDFLTGQLGDLDSIEQAQAEAMYGRGRNRAAILNAIRKHRGIAA